MSTPAEVIARRRRQQGALLQRVHDFIETFDPRLGVRAVAVFGSVARGDFHEGSDVDVLVVADDLPAEFGDRLKAVGAPAPTIDPVVWTPAEWLAQRARGNPIAVEACEQGVWLQGNPESLQERY